MIMIVVGSDSYSLVGSASYSRSLSQNCSKAADAPPHRYPWPHIERVPVLARESHGDFFFPRQLLPRAKGMENRLRISIVKEACFLDISTSSLYSGFNSKTRLPSALRT